MTHYTGLAESEIEELLEELWTLEEHGRDSRHDAVTGSKLPDAAAVLRRRDAPGSVRSHCPPQGMSEPGPVPVTAERVPMPKASTAGISPDLVARLKADLAAEEEKNGVLQIDWAKYFPKGADAE